MWWRNYSQNLFQKIKIEHFSRSMVQSFIQLLFIPCQVESYLKVLKLNCWQLALTSYNAFLKKQRGLELVSLPHFLHDFWRTIIILLYSINWPSFIVWLPLLREILSNMCIAIVCWPVCDVINFEINLIFLINPFSLIWPKIQDKNLNILRKKRAFKMK